MVVRSQNSGVRSQDSRGFQLILTVIRSITTYARIAIYSNPKLFVTNKKVDKKSETLTPSSPYFIPLPSPYLRGKPYDAPLFIEWGKPDDAPLFVKRGARGDAVVR